MRREPSKLDELMDIVTEEDTFTLNNFLLSNPDLDINTGDYFNRTALHCASDNNFIAIRMVSFLLRKGANPNVITTDKLLDTPLINVLKNPSIRDLGAHHTVSLLIEKNVDVNQTSRFLETPLMAAVVHFRREFDESVSLLINAGAKLDAEDHQGATALTKAILYIQYEHVFTLLEAGATVKANDLICAEEKVEENKFNVNLDDAKRILKVVKAKYEFQQLSAVAAISTGTYSQSSNTNTRTRTRL